MIRRGGKLFVGLLVAGVLLVGIVTASLTYLFAAGSRATNASQSSAVPVHIIIPKKGGIERTVTRPASVHAFEFADIYAKVAGYLGRQVVDIGYSVQKDQVLAEIDAPEIDTKVQQTTADLAKAKAQVGVMEARQRAAETGVQAAIVKVAQAKADLASAKATVELRTKVYNRIKSLVEAKAVEQKLADEQLDAKQAAEADEMAKREAVNTAEVAVDTARAGVAMAVADLEDARAQVKVAEAALARAQVFQAYLKIRSPFAGVITRRNYHVGDFIREGTSNADKPILSIARTDLMRVIVDVPDPDVPFTHQGSPADVAIDSLPGQVFHSKVARTALSEDYNSRTMRTEIDLPNSDGALASGMFGKATIHLGADPHALTIPSTCLVGAASGGGNSPDQRSVFVVKGGKAHLVEVRIGRDNGIAVEVRSGLQATDQVIDSHGPGLVDGAPVKVEAGD